MRIESDNPTIEKNLHFLEKTILDHDGWLDPDLTITCYGGEMSVTKDGFFNPTKPLIALPEVLLLPSERLGLSVSKNDMQLSPDDKLSPIQKQLAESMIEIYNLTAKIELHKQSCCWISFKEAPELLQELLAGRSINENHQALLDFTTGVDTGTSDEEFACKTYVKTRTIGHKVAQNENEDMVMTTDIMPIVDFINHNISGSGFVFGKYAPHGMADTKRTKALMVNDARPLPYSNECFAFYNQMDSLDTFINYGFPDMHTPYVRSVPLSVDLGDIGTVQINSYLGRGAKGKLSKSLANLRPFIPPLNSKTNDKLVLSHLFIPATHASANAMRRSLRLVLSNWFASSSKGLKPQAVWEAVLAIESQVISENIAFYKTLAEKADKSDAPEHLRAMVKDICVMQLTKLHKYTFDESHYTTDAEAEIIKKAAAAE